MQLVALKQNKKKNFNVKKSLKDIEFKNKQKNVHKREFFGILKLIYCKKSVKPDCKTIFISHSTNDETMFELMNPNLQKLAILTELIRTFFDEFFK